MDADADTPPSILVPFPNCSVNVLAGPSSVGKSHFVQHVLRHLPHYFSQPVRKIWVVHCNNIVPEYRFGESPLEHPHFEQLSLQDFDPVVLEANDLLVFEDLQELTPQIRKVVNVYAHHANLASVFLVTHSVVGNNLFQLLSICHRVLWFLRAAGISRQAFYVCSNFFQDLETRAYLKTLFGFVERHKNILLLEINPLANQPVQHLAISHLAELTKGYCLLYPHLGSLHSFAEAAVSAVGETPQLSPDMTDQFDFGPETKFPAHTFVAVPAETVLLKKRSKGGGQNQCADKSLWDELLGDIELSIEQYFKSNRWLAAKNLAREILSCPEFCLTQDGRTIHLKKWPKSKASLLDYLSLATRRPGPTETSLKPEWKVFAQFTRVLLQRGAPDSLFRNRLLVQGGRPRP